VISYSTSPHCAVKDATVHCKKIDEIPGFVLKKTFLGLGLGKLFPARESLVSHILAGDVNTAKPLFTV